MLTLRCLPTLNAFSTLLVSVHGESDNSKPQKQLDGLLRGEGGQWLEVFSYFIFVFTLF